MRVIQKIAVIIGYEWRRALAKKVLLALIALALAFQILTFVALSSIPRTFITDDIKKTMWIIGVLSGQSLLVHLIAIQVAGSSMAEEYEQGTADVLLSKPITKTEYLIGKFLGGFLLLSIVELITTITGVVLAYGLFGIQRDVQFVPLIFLAIIYSMLLFYSMTFMFSEVLRRSNLAMMVSFGIFAVSSIVGAYLLYNPEQLYRDISQLLPTWSATALSSSLAVDLMLLPKGWFTIGGLTSTSIGDTKLAAIIIAVYTVIFVVLTYLKFVRSDITKKAA